MVRSTQTSIKFSNREKIVQLHKIIDEYRNITAQFINLLWDEKSIPALLPKNVTSKINTRLSARMIQCAGKQASGIVRGTQKKQKQRMFMIDKLKSEGNAHGAQKLQKVYDNSKISKPNIQQICPELDSRFIKIDLENNTSFDGWLTFASIGNNLKLNIPFKKTKHFNKLLQNGKLKGGIRLSKKQVTFMFEIPDVEKRTTGSTLGVDVGQTTTVSCSNGQVSKANAHGHDLVSITDQLSSCAKGSNGFKRAQTHRTNYINWSINQLNFDSIKILKIEKLHQMRKGKRVSRKLSHWTYTAIFDKLLSKCEEQGVLVQKISPSYTSQRCSDCGWTDRSNRNGKIFICTKCSHKQDADLNAAINIAADLESANRSQSGFYWLDRRGNYSSSCSQN